MTIITQLLARPVEKWSNVRGGKMPFDLKNLLLKINFQMKMKITDHGNAFKIRA